MIKSIPRRAYGVLITTMVILGFLATVLLHTIPSDSTLAISKAFSHSAATPEVSTVAAPAPLATPPPPQDPPSKATPAPAAPERKVRPDGKDIIIATPKESKYFYEAGGGMGLIHYDKRYFVKQLPYHEHLVVLRNLLRSYMAMTRESGIETWLAHGTLLGWWWNTRIMPWDYDLDVQVNDTTLAMMGTKYNLTKWRFELDSFRIVQLFDGALDESDTKIQDAELALALQEQRHRKHVADAAAADRKIDEGDSHDSVEDRQTSYLLDVNPNSAQRFRGGGRNVIDARWIDMSNGMFIDITGLSELDPQKKPGVVSCKNNHHYQAGWLFPLKKTEFEGVPAMVPNQVETVLADEYGKKSMEQTEWADHKWDPTLREWIKKGWFAE